MVTRHAFYESLILLNPALDTDGQTKILDRVENIIKDENGQIFKKDVWGTRKLAFPIKKTETGYYVLLYFKAHSSVQQKLSKYYTVTPDVWRHMTLKMDEQMVEEQIPASLRGPVEPKPEEN